MVLVTEDEHGTDLAAAEKDAETTQQEVKAGIDPENPDELRIATRLLKGLMKQPGPTPELRNQIEEEIAALRGHEIRLDMYADRDLI